MNFKSIILTTCALASISTIAQAAEWKSEAELGFVMTSGNSETQSTNGKISASRDTEKWTQSGRLEALNTSATDKETDTESTTAEKYSAHARADYKLNDDDFLFASADYYDDRFSGFQYQATLAAGYGRRIINTDKQSLKAEIGPGVRYVKAEPVGGVHIPSDEEGIVRAAAYYAYNFSEQATFTQDLIADIGEDATITESITALKAQISGKLAMKASVKIRNISEVEDPIEDTDTETALTLVYSLK